MQQCKLLKEYQNGNYKVRIYSDGTKIRFSNSDEFVSEFPESIDLKITNRCDLRCPMCHEKSTPSGKNASLDHPFLDTLVPGTELAIGGGNPLDHPELVPFLIKMKNRGVICNITVNQTHLYRYKELIQKLIDNELVYGVGISVTKDLFLEDVIEFCAKNPNCVIHVIVCIITKEVLEKLSNKGLKILFLGFKYKGRGKFFITEKHDKNKEYLMKNILEISKGFDIVSFDNAAIVQLRMRHKVANFEEVYMGDDGEFTMYIDLVKRQFAISSVHSDTYPLMDNIKDMFKKVKEENIEYHIEYYLTKDNKEMLFSTLKEDDSYTYYFDEEKREWIFSGLRLKDINRPMEMIDENVAILITMGEFVEELYEEMFGLRIHRKKYEKTESVEDLVKSLVDFSKDHYKYGNDKRMLHLSAKELEEAYHSGFYELIEKYHKDINNQKEKYPYINIEEKDDDFIVHIDEEVVKE